MNLETVAVETPASFATSIIVLILASCKRLHQYTNANFLCHNFFYHAFIYQVTTYKLNNYCSAEINIYNILHNVNAYISRRI